MLRSLKELEHYAVSATDGNVGTVVNFLFDDERWIVRHLVVETGSFLAGRRVLVSPIAFRMADWSTRHFYVALTMDKIRHSPSVDVDKPVSRQHELDHYGYYGYPTYWGYAGIGGPGPYPDSVAAKAAWNAVPKETPAGHSGGVHLRSAREIYGYHVKGKDEAIGHIDDFIVDDETWEIRYLVIDTKNWWFGKKVLVSPYWTNRISWLDQVVFFDASRQAIKDSPEWNPHFGVNREYESRLYDYYGRPVYWNSATQQPGSPPQSHPGSDAR